PDNGAGLLDKKADRNNFDPKLREWNNHFLAIRRRTDPRRQPTQSQHNGQGWTIDIGIKHPNLQAKLSQSNGEIDGYRRFSHAALTGADHVAFEWINHGRSKFV